MTERQQEPKKETGSASSKGGLVQFRADEALMADLAQVADRLHMPIGGLARLWVTERLEKELSYDIQALEDWRLERYRIIDKAVEEEFMPGPLLVLHLLPFQRLLELEPERIRQYQGLLPPVERVDEFSGRINFEGYETVKRFKVDNRLAGRVQVFATGQIESIRELRTDDGIIYADFVEDDLIRAVWSYSCVLEALQVKLPVALFVAFKRMRGYALRSPRFASPSAEINYGELLLQGISIKDWSDVLTIERAAQTVKKILDKFANSAGLSRSMSYSQSGEWLGPIESPSGHARRTKMVSKTEVLELVGTNADLQRVDLIFHDAGEDMVIGKVRAPYLEPTASTRFKILVLQDDMAQGAKQRLEYKRQMKQPVKMSAGKIKFTGYIDEMHEGFAATSGNPLSIQQDKTLLIYLEAGVRSPTPGTCATCGRRLMPGEGINTPSRGTLCRGCFG